MLFIVRILSYPHNIYCMCTVFRTESGTIAKMQHVWFSSSCLLMHVSIFKEWVELQDDDSSQNTRVKENWLLFSYLGTLALNLAYNNNLLVFHSTYLTPVGEKISLFFRNASERSNKSWKFSSNLENQNRHISSVTNGYFILEIITWKTGFKYIFTYKNVRAELCINCLGIRETKNFFE